MKKTLLSFLILALFIYGAGRGSFFPSLRLLRDMDWDPSLLLPIWERRLAAYLWVVPAGLGFCGWTVMIRNVFLRTLEPAKAHLLGFSLAVSFFSLYVFGLAVNGILYWPLTLLFFAPFWAAGWNTFRRRMGSRPGTKSGWAWVLVLPALPWLLEYLSPPIIWDAVLDHFRFAREVSRLHQIPFHWTNHTGDMPKFAELILAGFWNLGGEGLSRLSGSLAALMMVWVFGVWMGKKEGNFPTCSWIFLTCPFFLAVFAWGYVEGFLAFYEILALFCLWEAFGRNPKAPWFALTMYFLGTAYSIKYTALFAIGALAAIFLYEKGIQKNKASLGLLPFALFLIPALPWALRGILAYGNPVYPMGIAFFGGTGGYSPSMESGLWKDTGFLLPGGWGESTLRFWKVLFTPSNSVGALWTPLVLMGLPWMGKPLRDRFGRFLAIFIFAFFIGWFLLCTNLRHAAGGLMALLLLSSWGWSEALSRRGRWNKILFGAGLVLSFWLCLSAQWTSTAPYASALGFEDSNVRLKRNFSMDEDIYPAYRAVERDSGPWDKTVAFGVFQTYPLQRTAFVDFFWKKPMFLAWADSCGTAEQLAGLLRRKGITHFIYQKAEAVNASFRERDFGLDRMGTSEYIRFWKYYAVPIAVFGNTVVYRVRDKATTQPGPLLNLPGIQEKALGASLKDVFHGQTDEAYRVLLDWVGKYPDVGAGWGQRAALEKRLGLFDKAVASGRRAERLGDRTPEVCDIMVYCLEKLKRGPEADQWARMGNDLRWRRDAAVQEALSYYRSVE